MQLPPSGVSSTVDVNVGAEEVTIVCWYDQGTPPPPPPSDFTVTFTKAVTTSGAGQAPAAATEFDFDLDCIGTDRTFALADGESFAVTVVVGVGEQRLRHALEARRAAREHDVRRPRPDLELRPRRAGPREVLDEPAHQLGRAEARAGRVVVLGVAREREHALGHAQRAPGDARDRLEAATRV